MARFGQTEVISKGGPSLRPWPGPPAPDTTDVREPAVLRANTDLSRSAFHQYPNPVPLYLRALQKTLSVPLTGSWDYATHAALRRWALQGGIEIGSWGADPAKVARNAVVLLDPSSETEFQRAKTLYGLLGYPNDALVNYANYMKVERLHVLPVLDQVQDAIRAAESSVPPPPLETRTPVLAKASLGWGIGAVIAILPVSAIIYWLIRRRKKPVGDLAGQCTESSRQNRPLQISCWGDKGAATAWVEREFSRPCGHKRVSDKYGQTLEEDRQCFRRDQDAKDWVRKIREVDL